MNCAEIKEYLHEYADGCVEASRKEQIEAHLRACPACRAEVNALQNLSAQLHALRILETDDFKVDMARVKAPLKVNAFNKWVPRVAAIAACFVILVGAVVWGGVRLKPALPQNGALGSLSDATPQMTAGETADEPVYAGDNEAAMQNTKQRSMHEPIQQDEDLQASYDEASRDREITVQSSVTPEVANETAMLYAAPESANEGFSGGGSAYAGQKHVIQIMVLPEGKEAAYAYMNSVKLADFGEETVLPDAAVAQLLSMEGVRVITDAFEQVTTDIYFGNTVIIY